MVKCWSLIVISAILVSLTYARTTFRQNCIPLVSGAGCTCQTTNGHGGQDTIQFNTDDECKKPVEFETAENKKALNAEIKQKFGGFRENCFPRGSGHGCTCSVTNAHGREETVQFDTDEKCKKPVEMQTADNKKALNEEFTQKVAGLRENCFPRPSGHGCRCTEKDASGHDVERRYDSDAECKMPSRSARNAPSQNVRDPVREQAQRNYAAVVDELKNKFKGLKEGCYPRPKGCLCVTGRDSEGRDITQRRLKDSDCKCQPGDRSRECRAQGA